MTKQERHDALMAELAAMRRSIDALTAATRAPKADKQPRPARPPYGPPYPYVQPRPWWLEPRTSSPFVQTVGSSGIAINGTMT